MEQAFANLQKDGKNDVDNLIKWMKDSKVIDAKSKAQENKARSLFNDATDKQNVTLDQFKGIVTKLAAEFKTNFDGIQLTKVINQTKEQEEKVRSYFNDVVDKKNVTLEKFKEVINKVVEEFKTSFEVVTKKLAEHGPKLLQTAVDGATSTLTGFVKDLVPKM